MTLSMYQASVPVFVKMLTNLKGVLQKAAAYAQARKIDEAVLVNARLYPDMLPLSKQIQIASDFARSTAARLGGAEPPVGVRFSARLGSRTYSKKVELKRAESDWQLALSL